MTGFPSLAPKAAARVSAPLDHGSQSNLGANGSGAGAIERGVS